MNRSKEVSGILIYMVKSIVDTGVGCSIDNKLTNILAYADDIVLIAPRGGSTRTDNNP